MGYKTYLTTRTKQAVKAKSPKPLKEVKTYYTVSLDNYNVTFLVPVKGGVQDIP